MDAKDLQNERPSKKLDDKRFGPFEVLEVVGPNAYKLRLPARMKIHPVFNTVKLRPYKEDPIPDRVTHSRPGPVIKGDNPEWEVEYIEDSKLKYGKLHYLVKWKGFPKEESTWEPADHLKKVPKIVQEFHAKHPFAPRRISALTFS